MIKNDEEILTFEELRDCLNLSANELTKLTDEGLPFISFGDKKVFLASSVKIHFGRIEEKKVRSYPPERERR